MIQAKVGDIVIAQSEETQVVEGNHYFPPDAVQQQYLQPTDHSTHCPWKGDASYFTLQVEGRELTNAAWTYPQPFEKAEHIRDHIAFYKGKGIAVEKVAA